MDLATPSQAPAAAARVRILIGECRERMRELAERSVHCVVTSPPYYSLRDYRVPPSVWPAHRSCGEGGGGDAACDHEWADWQEVHDRREETIAGKSRTTDRYYGAPSRRFDGNHQKHAAGAFCANCGA